MLSPAPAARGACTRGKVDRALARREFVYALAPLVAVPAQLEGALGRPVAGGVECAPAVQGESRQTGSVRKVCTTLLQTGARVRQARLDYGFAQGRILTDGSSGRASSACRLAETSQGSTRGARSGTKHGGVPTVRVKSARL